MVQVIKEMFEFMLEVHNDKSKLSAGSYWFGISELEMLVLLTIRHD